MPAATAISIDHLPTQYHWPWQRHPKLTTIICLFLLAIMVNSYGFASTGPPNILLILVDDLGVNDIGVTNNNPLARTPNIDNFANEGVRFTRHYTDTVCSPSRAALLTGLYPPRLGYRPMPRGISPDILTLADSLRNRGYSTHHIGKWHIGDNELPAAGPDQQGFDSYFSFLSQWLLSGQHHNGKLIPTKGTYFNPWLTSNQNPAGQRYEGHLADILVERTITTIEQSPSQSPWFINYWTYLPHHPIEPAERFAAGRPNSPSGLYYSMVDHLDNNLGRVLDALEQSGQADNTIVVIASDNGGTNVQADNNAPYQGRKLQYREGSVRTPLMIRWPGKYPAGKVIDQTVAMIDLYPTLATAVGAEVPTNLDGRDISPAVYDQSLSARPLYWELASDTLPFFSILSADGRWRLYHSPLPYEESAQLYDLQTEPSGATNVIEKHPGIASLLNYNYRQWHREVRRFEPSYQVDSQGNAQLTGQDFLRAPGWQAFTFLIGVNLNEDITKSQLPIADQPGIWQLSYNDESGFTAQIGQYRLSSQHAIDQTCHAVMVSAQFKTPKSHQGRGGRIGLYIDGIEVDSIMVELPPTRTADLSTPTYLGYPPGTGKNFPGKLSRPVMISIDVSKDHIFDPKNLAQEVCPDSSFPE